MHALFGVEPAAINNWQDMRYVIGQFGMSKGALIAQIPKSWPRLVIEECKSNPAVKDVEHLKIIEKLKQAKDDQLFRPRVHYEPEKSWTENILSDEVSNLLKGVITSADAGVQTCFTVDDLPDGLFENCSQYSVKQSAEELANVARFVVADAETITLVDPYFSPSRKSIKVLKKLIDVAQSQSNKLREVFIFTATKENDKHDDIIEREYRAALDNFVEKGITYHIARINRQEVDMDLHARFLLTPKAGLKYDRSFQEPEEVLRREQDTVVICLVPRINKSLLDQYSMNNSDLVYTQVIEVRT